MGTVQLFTGGLVFYSTSDPWGSFLPARTSGCFGTAGFQVVTTILGIIVYYLGYTSVSFINGMVIPVAKDPNYYETRFSWIYYHKSQYCFVLLLFIAFSVICRKQFKNKWFFPVSNLVFLFGIVISHTYTALFAAVLIYAGLALDALRSKLRTLNKKYFLLLIPPVILLAFVIWRMSRERNIWTLGSRTYIWAEGIRQILKILWGLEPALDLPNSLFREFLFRSITATMYF